MSASPYRQWTAIVLAMALLSAHASAAEETGTEEAIAEEPTELSQSEVPIVPVVVHHREHSLEKRWQIQAGPAYLSGDRYLTTGGGGLGVSYFFRESIGVAGGFYILRSSASDNAKSLVDRRSAPVAHNPSSLAFLNFVYSPWYGKFNLGSRIQRFHWSLSLGAHLAQESTSSTVQARIVESKSSPGGNLGTQILFPLGERFSLGAQVQAFFHGKLLEDEASGRRNILYGVQLGYLL